MRLQCAEILEILRHKPIAIVDQWGIPTVVRAADSGRRRIVQPLLPQIHRAEKFIFDSGSDQDADTVQAVRQTSVAMMEADLFHQPYPTIWVEDPYEDDPDKMRNFYLGIEEPGKITVFAFNRINPQALLEDYPGEDIGKIPALSFHPFPLEIDITNPSDEFRVQGIALGMSPQSVEARVLGEAIYAYKKLIVTLATSNHQSEHVAPRRHKGIGTQRFYEHYIIRVPIDPTAPQDSDGSVTGKRRRMHLVRGYIYGKNTRPLAEQRWVKPYWRGDKELGVVAEREHYEVR